MEFLKPVLGDALYEQVQRKLEGQKDIKLANLALGQYVDKRKFKAKAAALEKAEERIQTLEQALKDSQARYVQTELICAAEGLLQKAMKCLRRGRHERKGKMQTNQTKAQQMAATCWRTGRLAALFSVIGTRYGMGDGSTTFNVPNLCGRVPVGADSTIHWRAWGMKRCIR